MSEASLGESKTMTAGVASSRVVTEHKQPKPRLIITNMILQDFKSYGGRKEIGPFHKSFSCVVGPNGSGKSNVIDAMLFVFGKRAKALRLKNVSELIHQSSLRRAEFCSVTVYFAEIIDHTDNSGGYDVVPGSEFSIKRTANQKNVSDYYIGERLSTATEVTNLLRTKHIDLDNNRFLILQGEVEAIATMKPMGTAPGEVGLLEYLEEIIGSSKYIDDIVREKKKLDALSKIVSVECERLRRCEGALDSLQKDMDDVKNCLESDIKCQTLVKELSTWGKYDSQLEMSNLSELESRANAEIEKAIGIVADKQRAKELNSKSLSEWQDKNSKMSVEIEKLQEKMSELDRKDAEYRENYADRMKTLKSNKDRLTKLTDERNNIMAAAERDTEALPRLREEIAECQRQENAAISDLDKAIESSRGRTESHRKRLEEKQAELLPLESLRTEAMRKRQECENELSILRERRDTIHQKKTSLNKELTDALKRAQDNRSVAQVAERRLQMIELELKEAEEKLTQLKQNRQMAADKVQEVTVKVSQMRESMGAQHSRGAIVSQLMKKKREDPNNFKGIIGVLGDLGSIGEEYDVAVSTAASALKHIVTDTTRTAQNCLSFLRESRLGTATFICLDKMHELYGFVCQQPFEAPQGSKRLLDLITTEDRYKPLFYHAMRDTLVTDTLESATQISFDGRIRRRVVTIKGEIVEPHGAMSGGGSHSERGAMKLNASRSRDRGESNPVTQNANEGKDQVYSQEEINAAENERQRVMGQLGEIDRTISTLSSQVQKFRSELIEMRAKHSRIQSQQGPLDNQVHILEQELQQESKVSAEEEKQIAASDSRIVELEGLLQNYKQEESKASAATARYEADLREIKRSLAEAGGLELRKLKDAVTKIKRQYENKQAELARTSASAEGSTSKIQRIEEQERVLVKENELIQSACVSITESMSKLENDALRVLNDIKNSERTLKEQKDIEKELTNDQIRIDEELRKITSNLADLKADKENLKRRVIEQNSRIAFEEKKIQDSLAKLRKLRADLDRTKPQLTNAEILYVERKAERELEREQMEALARERELMEQKEDGLEAKDSSTIRTSVPATVSESSEPIQEDFVDLRQEDEEVEALADQSPENETEREIKEIESEENTISERLRIAQKRIEELTRQLKTAEAESKKNVANLRRIGEYRKQLLEVNVHSAIRAAKEKERDEQRKLYDELRKKRLDMFNDGFKIISQKLKEIYQMLTEKGDGDAELEIKDSDPFAEGIDFSVRPPKKTWKRIQHLSGGEKTLSSLSLVFALHHFKPTPLYVMDEIDAALDRKNVSIVGKYIQQRTSDAQFIVISLRNSMFELADRLVGIYKTNNITKSVTIDPRGFVRVPNQETSSSTSSSSGNHRSGSEPLTT